MPEGLCDNITWSVDLCVTILAWAASLFFTQGANLCPHSSLGSFAHADFVCLQGCSGPERLCGQRICLAASALLWLPCTHRPSHALPHHVLVFVATPALLRCPGALRSSMSAQAGPRTATLWAGTPLSCLVLCPQSNCVPCITMPLPVTGVTICLSVFGATFSTVFFNFKASSLGYLGDVDLFADL
jgi:hypothetical protein